MASKNKNKDSEEESSNKNISFSSQVLNSLEDKHFNIKKNQNKLILQ